MEAHVAKSPKEEVKTINVRVVTTSGTYPENGHEKVPLTEPIQGILSRAAADLGVVDTSRWVVTVKGSATPISPTTTYEQAGLHGEVKLDWGPESAAGG